MVTDKQVRMLMELLGKGKNLCTSAAKADMDEKTARKYRGLNKLPNEMKGIKGTTMFLCFAVNNCM